MQYGLPLPNGGRWYPNKSIHIQNIQCTSGINVYLDCEALATELPGARYNVRTPHRVDVFLDQPRARAALFRPTGKIMIMGGKSIQDAEQAVHTMITQLQAYGHRVGVAALQHATPTPIRINNISSAGYLGKPVDLAAFASSSEHEDNIVYENEMFPGLRYKNLLPEINGSINASVFYSGKFLLLGCITEEQVLLAFERLIDITAPFVTGLPVPIPDERVTTNIQSAIHRGVQYVLD